MAIARRVSVTLKASDIMAKKGIEEKKLKTGELNKIIGEFFMTHEAKDTILLSPKRFIEMDNPPEGDFIDYLDVSIWEKKCDDPNDPFDFIENKKKKKKGMLRPILIIDEPLIRNAALYLRDICCFTVKSRTRKKKKEYIVSLPLKTKKEHGEISMLTIIN